MNRWHVYEYLKRNNGVMTIDFFKEFKSITDEELVEGVEEYEEMAMKNADYYDVVTIKIERRS